MDQSYERKLLRIIRLAPALIIGLVTLAVIGLMVHYNRLDAQESLETLRSDYTQQAKNRIKLEVDSVHRQLVYEKDLIETELKSQIKQRVYEAYAVMDNIYDNNRDKPEAEQVKLITDALREIRFNDGRGYYFLYQMDGTNLLLPHLPHLEGESLWDLKDSRSLYIVRELIDIAGNQGEGYHRWWFYKPQDLDNDLEKIGFVKYFAPLNLMIGTGEYLLDFEKDVQQSLLARIAEIHYGESGFMFVLDNSGTFLVHKDEALRNFKGFNLYDEDEKHFYIRKIMAAAREGGGYLRYKAPYKPPAVDDYDKISYVRLFDSWDWTIGTGVFVSDLEEYLTGKEQQLRTQSEAELMKLIIFSFLIASVMFALAAYLSGKASLFFKKQQLRSSVSATEEQSGPLSFVDDPLTALPNRVRFSLTVRERIVDAEYSGRLVAVVLVGLDDFKTLNDEFGQGVCDKVLANLAQHASAILDRNDSVCRYGGDEFGFCFPDLVKMDELYEKVDILQQVFAGRLQLDGVKVNVSATLGVAIYPDDGLSGEELVANADIALYRAKVSDKGGVRYYDLSPAC